MTPTPLRAKSFKIGFQQPGTKQGRLMPLRWSEKKVSTYNKQWIVINFGILEFFRLSFAHGTAETTPHKLLFKNDTGQMCPLVFKTEKSPSTMVWSEF